MSGLLASARRRLATSDQVVALDLFERTNGALGTADSGDAWKNDTNFVISSGRAIRSGGSGRVFALLPTQEVVGDVVIEGVYRTSTTTNRTDGGLALLSLDSPTTRGGQLYLSFRKISGTNSIRLLRRQDLSGSDLQYAINSAAGWVDNTSYAIKVTVTNNVVECFVNGVSMFTPYTMTSGVRTALGRDTGITSNQTNNDESGWESLQVTIPGVAGAALIGSKMLSIVHRGIAISEQEVSYVTSGGAGEESLPGLETLMVNHPRVNGVEVDAWLSTDNVCFLAHDPTGDRVHGFAARYDSKTAAQLDALGVTRLSAYLVECAKFGFRKILVQHESPQTAAKVGILVDTVRASPVADRVMLMTSATGSAVPVFSAFRNATGATGGWTGLLGVYGIDSAEYSTWGADMATYNVDVAFTPAGAYGSNRGIVPTLLAAGYEVGGSTIDTLAAMDQMQADGCTYLLTNLPGTFEAKYFGPNPI